MSMDDRHCEARKSLLILLQKDSAEFDPDHYPCYICGTSTGDRLHKP